MRHDDETPLMQQYREIKARHHNAILFFRMGDFYEMFYDDAETASRVLGLTLTSRNNGGAASVPLAGFFGKFYLFKPAMESHQLYWLVVLAVLNSVVSVYYYLRIIVAMYFRDPMRPLAPTDGATMRTGLFLAAIAVVLLGVFPSTFVDWAGPIALK